MTRTSDPEWGALEARFLAWDERIRARERAFQQLDARLRELQDQLGALKRRIARGTGVMTSVPEPSGD